jgi:D-alanine-D-alanine ligase
MEKLKITLFYDSVEDEKAAADADIPVYQQVLRSIENRGHQVRAMSAESKIKSLVAQIEKDDSDIIFNLCESLGGVDTCAINVASLLELMGKPFTGTGSVGMVLAQDKGLSKKIFHFHNIKYPKFSIMDAGQVEWSDQLSFPVFVKPLNADSSIGIDQKAIVRNIKELMERISYIHTEINAPALIEEYIEGREIYVGVLGNEALPLVEWDFSKLKKNHRIATAEAKWNKESDGYKAPEVFPEDIPETVQKGIQQAAVDACRSLKILDYGRVDFRLRTRRKPGEEGRGNPEEWEYYIIEVNPNPYLDQKTAFAMAARKSGLSYPEMVEKIIELAMRRRKPTEKLQTFRKSPG